MADNKEYDAKQVCLAIADTLKEKVKAYSEELRKLRHKELAKSTAPDALSEILGDCPLCGNVGSCNCLTFHKNQDCGYNTNSDMAMNETKKSMDSGDGGMDDDSSSGSDMSPMAMSEPCVMCGQKGTLCKCMGGYAKKSEDFIDIAHENETGKRLKNIGGIGVMPDDVKSKKIPGDEQAGDITKDSLTKAAPMMGAKPPSGKNPASTVAPMPKAGSPTITAAPKTPKLPSIKAPKAAASVTVMSSPMGKASQPPELRWPSVKANAPKLPGMTNAKAPLKAGDTVSITPVASNPVRPAGIPKAVHKTELPTMVDHKGFTSMSPKSKGMPVADPIPVNGANFSAQKVVTARPVAKIPSVSKKPINSQKLPVANPIPVVKEELGFAKLKGKLEHEKGVTDPGALAASIGRKKYGAKGMAEKASKAMKKSELGNCALCSKEEHLGSCK